MNVITSFKAKGRSKMRIEVWVDDALWETLDAETVVRAGLRKGEAFDAKRQREVLALEEKIKARKSAATHASHGGKTERELERRLREKRFSPEAIASAIKTLLQSGTINDERTARRHVTKKLRTGRTGPRRIAAELAARGVDSTMARKTMDEQMAEVDFKAECRALAEKVRAKYEPLAEPKNRARLMQYLARRGYEADHVRAAVEALGAGGEF